MVDQKPSEPMYPNRFSRDRCLLLIRFLIFLASGATMFQMAMLTIYKSPSNLLIITALITLSVLLLIGALSDLLVILKMRSIANRV